MHNNGMLTVLIRIASMRRTTYNFMKNKKINRNICFLETFEEFRRDSKTSLN